MGNYSTLFVLQTGDELIDNSTNHGVGDHFKYTVGALTPHTDYYLKIAAINYLGEPVYSKQSAEFSTKGKLSDHHLTLRRQMAFWCIQKTWNIS